LLHIVYFGKAGLVRSGLMFLTVEGSVVRGCWERFGNLRVRLVRLSFTICNIFISFISITQEHTRKFVINLNEMIESDNMDQRIDPENGWIEK
jgi:hypothetical protein